LLRNGGRPDIVGNNDAIPERTSYSVSGRAKDRKERGIDRNGLLETALHSRRADKKRQLRPGAHAIGGGESRGMYVSAAKAVRVAEVVKGVVGPDGHMR